MEKVTAVIKAEMTSNNDNRYDSHLDIKGTKNDILNLFYLALSKS